MADSSNVSLIVSIGSVAGSVIALLTFWTRFSDRITRAQDTADDAIQDAAEAKNENENLRQTITQMIRNLEEHIDRSRRDEGESMLALRQHVTDLAMFVRDNFVRNIEFSSAMGEIKAGQLRLETKLDRVGEQMTSRSK